MPLSKTKLTVVGAAGLGCLGIVAAVLQWWTVAVAVVIALQVVGVALVALRRTTGDLVKTRKSVNRIERQLKSANARSSAVDEQIRADIADRLAELTELARAWDTSQNDTESMATRQR